MISPERSVWCVCVHACAQNGLLHVVWMILRTMHLKTNKRDHNRLVSIHKIQMFKASGHPLHITYNFLFNIERILCVHAHVCVCARTLLNNIIGNMRITHNNEVWCAFNKDSSRKKNSKFEIIYNEKKRMNWIIIFMDMKIVLCTKE